MTSFGAKRKPRVIQPLDDDELDQLSAGSEQKSSQPQGPIKFGRRPAKPSSLRRSINLNDDDDDSGSLSGAPVSRNSADDAVGDDDAGVPVVIRPGAVRPKKKAASLKPSFRPPGDDDEDEAPTQINKSKKNPFGPRAVSGRSAPPLQNLPARFLGGSVGDDRPRYSKEYIDELQNSTPNTPQDLSELRIADGNDDDDGNAMDLDPAELDGATIVRTEKSAVSRPSADHPAATVLTEAQIREKKERRARLAREETDFIPLDDGDGSDDEEGGGPVSVRFEKKKDKAEPRLIAEDEDLGEGYDEFVEDGGLSLGRKAEREAHSRQRREMAELIQAAEGGSDADSDDDSEAERRAAYETAQRRAGMDGLHRPGQDDDGEDGGGGGDSVVPRLRPLPDLDDCLRRMRDMVQGIEDEVVRRRATVEGMERERQEILQREKEVQEILDRAGAQYRESSLAAGALPVPATSATQSPLRQSIPPGFAAPPVERGLESFGTTPTARPDLDEMA